MSGRGATIRYFQDTSCRGNGSAPFEIRDRCKSIEDSEPAFSSIFCIPH